MKIKCKDGVVRKILWSKDPILGNEIPYCVHCGFDIRGIGIDHVKENTVNHTCIAGKFSDVYDPYKIIRKTVARIDVNKWVAK